MRLISKKAALRQRRSIVRTGCAMASDAALAGHAQPVDVPPPGQQQQRRLPPLVLYGQVKTRGRDEGMDGMYLHYWYTAPPPWLAVRSCPPPSHSPSLPTFLPSPSIPSSLSPSLPPPLPAFIMQVMHSFPHPPPSFPPPPSLIPSPPPCRSIMQVMSASVGFVRVELYEPGSVSLVEGRLQQRSQPPPRTGSDVGAATDSGGEAGAPAATQLPRRDLLCNLRSILRKLGKRVLVGDQVREGGAS